MNIDFTALDFPQPPSETVFVRIIQAHLGHSCTERVTIGVAGLTSQGIPIGRVAFTKQALKHFPKDVGASLHGFASLSIADFEEHVLNGKEASQWVPPFSAIEALPLEISEGDTTADALGNALAWHSAFFARSESSPDHDRPTVPRSDAEGRFLAQVRAIATQRYPDLDEGFRKHFSLSMTLGGKTEIDFCGSHYLTCYTAINPKSRRSFRGAEGALWRIARARDTFGFAGPKQHELTAWIPPDNLPIYSDQDYKKVQDEILELKYQAKKEEISVRSVHAASDAAILLLNAERQCDALT